MDGPCVVGGGVTPDVGDGVAAGVHAPTSNTSATSQVNLSCFTGSSLSKQIADLAEATTFAMSDRNALHGCGSIIELHRDIDEISLPAPAPFPHWGQSPVYLEGR